MSALNPPATQGLGCVDCGEPILESERRGARTCIGCKGLMHGECAMSTPAEDDACEACCHKDALRFRRRMKDQGIEP